ncbi:MAG: ribulose-phosphate 3-epimerase [bacterium]|nr:ribulose-phosphate 3-epimerase [bacterium]
MMENYWTAFPQDRLLAEISLWSANLACIRDDIARIEPYTDLFHLDVADAHFVPGLLFFPDLVAALRPLTQKPFHVHLMVENPSSLIDDFAAAGADLMTIHAENGGSVRPALEHIRGKGLRTGLAIQLETPLEAALPYLEYLDLIVLMGTKLGIKGVGLDERAPERITAMQTLLETQGYANRVRVAADGGIRQNTVPQLRAAGADSVVMGSLAFGSPNLDETFSWLHGLNKT